MNIYNFAIDMEKEGEAYYRELALKTPDVGLQKILNMLADDENKHTQIIKKMKAAGDLSMAETRVLKDAKNIERPRNWSVRARIFIVRRGKKWPIAEKKCCSENLPMKRKNIFFSSIILSKWFPGRKTGWKTPSFFTWMNTET
jgi:hypothetical protein